MEKKYSLKFWIIFWLLSTIFLGGWFLYWSIHFRGITTTTEDILNLFPISQSQKNQYNTLVKIGDYFYRKDGKEKTLLILFQNNLELRPGGGFIGAIGIVKLKNGKVLSVQTQDLSNFDESSSTKIAPPYPIQEVMGTTSWKLRDSNFSPDFQTDAQKAIELYRASGGQENFDGVIGLTSNVLTSILKTTGPVTVDGYPGSYDADNAIIALEYQVEKAFGEQGITRDNRKSIMGDLVRELRRKIFIIPTLKKISLAKNLILDLKHKDIQLEFTNNDLQQAIENVGWSGKVDENWNGDFLMTSDANLGSFKSDYYVKRSLNYTVDLSKDVPSANLKITYVHSAKQKDWMTRDYLTYLRVYVPQGSQILSSANFDNIQSGVEFDKQYFGSIVKVPLGSTKTVELNYALPNSIADKYVLKIQKQAGLEKMPISVMIVGKDGKTKFFDYQMASDLVIK